MKLLLPVFLLLLFHLPSFGQNTFVKTIDGFHFGQNVRVFQTPDQGIAVFSLDSLKLYKLNSCGEMIWANQYPIPKGGYAGDIIPLQNGDFVLLNRIPRGAHHSFSVTLIGGTAGKIHWSFAYEDPDQTTFPYTIRHDGNGDFIVFGNINHTATNQHNNFISKISPNGTLLWTRFYNFGPIWGGGIVTSDNSIVGRFGSTFFKADNSGNIQWALSVAGTNHYLPPIEVSDGYIFSGSSPTGRQVSFHKVSKQGNLLLGGRKVLEYLGVSSLLYQKSNGNFVGVFRKEFPGKRVPVLLEFDKELNIVQQSGLNFQPNLAQLNATFVGFSDQNTTLLAGTGQVNFSFGSQLFFAKTNGQFQTGCDTTVTTTITTEPVTVVPVTTNTLSHTFTVVNKTYVVKRLTETVTPLCGSLVPVQLNIRTDSILCPGSFLTLKNSNPGTFDTYLWSTGETTPAIAVTKPGKYWLRATSNCGATTATDTVTVTEIVFPKPALTADTIACFNKTVAINAEIKGATYRWQDGSTNPVFYAAKPGKYEVDITYKSCTKHFSVQLGGYEQVNMPNIFTPNGDRLNDQFTPIEMCGIASGTLKIFNRWGQLLYTTSEIGQGWNGRVNGKKTADGVYYYLLEYVDFKGEQKRKKGWVELVGS